METKKCISCGMPMEKKEMFAMNDETKDYCIYCADENGEMKTFEQKVEDLANFIMKRSGVTKEEAESTAIQNLRILPAWIKDK